MQFSSLPSLLWLALVASSQNLTQPSSLVALLSNSDAAGTIQGQTLSLPSFDLTLLTNSTHVLVSINISRQLDQIGWISVGFGTRMDDSALVVLWPSTDNSSWTISHRSATGYREPRRTRLLVPSADALFEVVPELASSADVSVFHHTIHYSTVAFLRPLELPETQTLFDHARYLNLSRTATDQRVVWAFSTHRPSSSDQDATIEMHDPGAFGWDQMDVSQVFSGGEVDGDQGWTK